MSKPYFLTRQTANLMEDFVRDLKSGGGVYLLYGDEGVGKTRLLEELTQARLQDVNVHWIDLKAGGSGEGALIDSSIMIEDIFVKAKTGDVIIADHFEKALKKSRHQLFLSWSTDGADKQINLIVAGNAGYFNELRQLAQQYQLRIQSFQLMPFSADDAVAFLGFYLFPHQSVGKLSVPPLLRNEISMSQGNVGKIVEIAERAGEQISAEPVNDAQPMGKARRVIVGVLITGALILAIGGYFYGDSRQVFDSWAQMGETPAISADHAVIIRQPVPTSPEPAVLLEDAMPTPDPAEAPGDSVVDKVDDDIGDGGAATQFIEREAVNEVPVPTDAPPINADTEVDTEGKVLVQNATASVDGLRATTTDVDELEPTDEQDEAVNDDSVPASISKSEHAPAIAVVLPSLQSEPSRLLQDLQASREWIGSRDSKIGTLQIMLLNKNRFDDRVYYDYLDRLGGQGVDTSKVRIFATYTGGQKVFSVVYGEYPSRRSANAAKASLPQILQDTAPIGRSVGGLMDEIQRLEGKN